MIFYCGVCVQLKSGRGNGLSASMPNQEGCLSTPIHDRTFDLVVHTEFQRTIQTIARPLPRSPHISSSESATGSIQTLSLIYISFAIRVRLTGKVEFNPRASPYTQGMARNENTSPASATSNNAEPHRVKHELIYETTKPAYPAPREGYYRDRLVLADLNTVTSSLRLPSHTQNQDADTQTSSFCLLPPPGSYAARYLSGAVPYPSLPTVGSVVPSTASFAEMLGLSAGPSAFSGCCAGDGVHAGKPDVKRLHSLSTA
jgi:hypothetical protein